MITDLTAGRVQKLAWSPKSNFLVTWHKPEAAGGEGAAGGGGGGEGEGTLRVFRVATGEREVAFNMKKMTSMAWPAIQWTADESYAMHMVSNEVSRARYWPCTLRVCVGPEEL